MFRSIFLSMILLGVSASCFSEEEYKGEHYTHPFWPYLLIGGVAWGVEKMDTEEKNILAGLGLTFMVVQISRAKVVEDRPISYISFGVKDNTPLIALNAKF